MQPPVRTSTLVLAALILCGPWLARGAEPARIFPASPQPSPQIISTHCSNGFYRAVVVLKNAGGLTGGYVLLPAIMDAPVPYLDANGDALATFHIFDSPEKKREAAAVIQQLKREFPLEEAADCRAQRG